MKPGILCLLLLSGCSDLWNSVNYRIYALTWSCLSPAGCERTDQVVLIDRVEIGNNDDYIFFSSSANPEFLEFAQLVPSDSLPDGCSLLHAVVVFTHELEPARLCRTSEDLELELSIPNPDPATDSTWLVEGRVIGP
jgi:hypothetical protein